MRGIFNKRPAFPKYRKTWNPDIVLNYLSSLSSNLTLLKLSQKVFLLRLRLTDQRGQSIHILKVEDVILYEDSLELQFSVVLKHTRPGVHQDNIRFQSYIQNKSLCIVSLLHEYIDITSNLSCQETQLFILTQAPFKGVARATVSRWVKSVMDKAGVDVKCFKPHCTKLRVLPWVWLWIQQGRHKIAHLGNFMTNHYRGSPVFNLQSWASDYDKMHLRCKYYLVWRELDIIVIGYTKGCNCFRFTLLDLYLLKTIDVYRWVSGGKS